MISKTKSPRANLISCLYQEYQNQAHRKIYLDVCIDRPFRLAGPTRSPGVQRDDLEETQTGAMDVDEELRMKGH